MAKGLHDYSRQAVKNIGNCFHVVKISGHWQCVLCCACVIRIKRCQGVRRAHRGNEAASIATSCRAGKILSPIYCQEVQIHLQEMASMGQQSRNSKHASRSFAHILYLVKKINASRSPAPVSDTLHSIVWMHQISGHVGPCKTDIV